MPRDEILSDLRTSRPVDLDWLESNFPCKHACPVHTEAGKYVALIAQGQYKEAYQVARAPNPFASICGRICAAPCEDVCRRGQIDAPIAIRALKRFVCEQYGVESLIDFGVIRELVGRQAPKVGKKVAVIGSGPAGMSCAHDLALWGYDVTVFEAQSVPGGMLRLGVPEYRLSRELIKLEIQFILSLGVELKLNTRLGRDFSLADLKAQGYEAIFLAIGAHKSLELSIEGMELDGVLRAVEFLLNVNLGYKVEFGEKVVVIGGGNVAFDVARTVLRHGEVPDVAVSDLRSAMDVARSAVRFGATEIHMVCLESRDEMLASEQEIFEGLEEGIKLHPANGPVRVLGESGKVKGLETVAVQSIFDAQGRFNPSYIPGTESVIEADTVIVAIGQAADLSFLQPEDGVELTPRRTIAVDSQTLATSAPGIFAGGDVAFGPRIAITAVADGQRAAQSIHTYLQGHSSHVEAGLSRPESSRPTIEVLDADSYQMPRGYTRLPRHPIPARPIQRRIGIAEVELGYSEEQACEEAQRCLHCWINTVFEGDEAHGTGCILCAACVDVCPEDCLELVPLAELGFPDQATRQHVEVEYELDLTTDPFLEGAAMLKDETRCIRCGLCAKRCPTGHITLESWHGSG